MTSTRSTSSGPALYTGLGALNWLPDLTRWADVVARLTKPRIPLMFSLRARRT